VLCVRLHLPADVRVLPLVKAVLLSLAVAGGAALASTVGVVLGVLVGLLLGLGGALVLRPLDGEDAEWLAGALGDEGARGAAARFVARLGSRG
jgi:hypothetical protein